MFLASAEQSLDEMPDALKTADSAVEVAHKSATNANDTANVLSLRASVEDEVGDFKSAERDYLESSQLYASSVGMKDFLYLQNENFRAQSLHLSGQRDAGIDLLESTTARIAVVRPGSNTLANALARLADAYLRDGAFAQATGAIEQALAIPAARHNLNLNTHLLLAQAKALTGLGRFPEATAKVNEALQALSADGPPSPYMTAEMHLLLGDVALSQGDFSESGRHLNLAGNACIGDTRRVRRQRARIHSMTARLAAARHDPVAAAAAAVSARQLTEAADIKTICSCVPRSWPHSARRFARRQPLMKACTRHPKRLQRAPPSYATAAPTWPSRRSAWLAAYPMPDKSTKQSLSSPVRSKSSMTMDWGHSSKWHCRA